MSSREPTYWPLNGLSLHAGAITMRPLVETDLDILGSLIPEDLEMNPHTPTPFGLEPRQTRAVALRQEYWKALGEWTPEAWELTFGVWLEDELAGTQTLEGKDFAVLRTVETASWLRADRRGRGLGKLARTAVLALAFDGLGARVALTEAWSDNDASLGVSRSLGYRPNGSVLHRRGDRADEMPRMRLDLADWRGRERPAVRIEGLAPCLPWFGLTAATDSTARRSKLDR